MPELTQQTAHVLCQKENMSEIIEAVIERSTNMSCICAQGILFQPSLGAVLTQSVLHPHVVCVTFKSRLLL